jgi:hypothetical protein
MQLQLRRRAASFCAAIGWSWQPAAAAPPITASASLPGGRGSIAAGDGESSFVAGQITRSQLLHLKHKDTLNILYLLRDEYFFNTDYLVFGINGIVSFIYAEAVPVRHEQEISNARK